MENQEKNCKHYKVKYIQYKMDLIRKFEVETNGDSTPEKPFGVKFRNLKGKVISRKFKTETLREEYINSKLKGVFSSDGKKMIWSNATQEYYVPEPKTKK